MPMRLKFQYRERVDPFAANKTRDETAIPELFQYRERVDPFAAAQ